MTRATAQNGDLDFEQMMGELAAMKTDLAKRQASRSGSRPSTPRGGSSEVEPRRTRARRAPSESRAVMSLETEASDPSNSSTHSKPQTQVPSVKTSTAMQEDYFDKDASLKHVQEQVQLDTQSEDQTEAGAQEHSKDQVEMKIEAAIQDRPATLSTFASSNLTTISDSATKAGQLSGSQLTDPGSPAISAQSGSGLTRSESRRNTAAPLPQKSAQRSRSISHGSSRLSQSAQSDHGDSGRDAFSSESTAVIPEEVSTPTFGPTIVPRKHLRPYPSSPSLSASNGQTAPASPRLPARSNSRNYAKPSTAAASFQAQPSPDHAPQGSPLISQAPVVPPRTRSGSKSLSRSNTINRSEGIQDPGSPYMGTPTIAEDQEALLESPRTPAATDTQSCSDQREEQQQPAPTSSENSLKDAVASDETNAMGHLRKQSTSNALKLVNRVDGSHSHHNHSLAPSLLPAEVVPTTTPVTSDQHNPALEHYDPVPDQGDTEQNSTRHVIRKQMSADPAAMYRQHQQEPVRDHLPSRHASERRPNHGRNPSQPAPSTLMELRESGHSRKPSGGSQPNLERGRSTKKDEGSSKGGMFAWVRSRSKSKDVSSAKLTYDTSHPVPEPTFEYNPALIPSRSGSAIGHQRAKSLPRKASNQNFHGTADGWPPYSPGDLRGDGPSHQRNKSITRPGLNPPPFTSVSSSGASNDTSAPSLNFSTNMNTVHHENMIRGMGMGSTPIAPAVLLTPQPSFPTAPGAASAAANGGMRGMALAMMKNDGPSSVSEQQMQQRHQQLQQAQMQHIHQQQQKLAISTTTQQQPLVDIPTSPRVQQQNGAQGPMSPTATAPTTQRLVATRIYIQTETDFKSVNLAPNSTALDALHMLQQRGCFGEPGDGRYHDRWTIFEYSKEFLIERPLRDFEVILDVMKTWEADKDNKMICKSFPARDELSAQEVVRLVGPEGQESFVRPHGWVHLETKKSKWVKRYLHITDTAVYHSKDHKFTGESMLCLLRNFDVYAVQVPRKKAPTKFGFALKSSDKIHLFETPEDDYIHYICTDSGESLREWLAGLRAAKGMFMYHANPEMIREGQKHAAELLSSSGNQDGKGRGNLTEEQVSMAEAKLAGWGMSLDRSRSVAGNRSH
ncbi:hypothetical protein BGX28_008955 [Mortierella sp. GBA30]|nr:hypothetical protein BGX28_008955 [Mortierella sp. GBA30]